MLARTYKALRGNRPLVVLAGLTLIALPTLFAVFPALAARVDLSDRELMMAGWVVVAVFTAIAAQTSDSERDRRARATHRSAEANHNLLLKQYLTLLLDPARSGIPSTYQVSVYLWDPNAQRLFPWFPKRVTDPSHPEAFEKGQGASGRAFQENKPVVAVGDAVSNAEFGLTPAQQEHYANDVVVVAVPLRLLAAPAPIGVLTVISGQNADETFTTRDAVIQVNGVGVLEDLADQIGDALSVNPVSSEA